MFVRSARIVPVTLMMAALMAPLAARAAETPVPVRFPMLLNIHIDVRLRPSVAEMLRSSATFRRQWNEVAQGHRVHVAVFMTSGPLEGTCRARTTMRRYSSGLLLAIVEIPPQEDYAELLAHEFEHVIEQIEGIDLASLARSGASGVRRRADGAYETLRARDAGRAVAAEVRLRANAE